MLPWHNMVGLVRMDDSILMYQAVLAMSFGTVKHQLSQCLGYVFNHWMRPPTPV